MYITNVLNMPRCSHVFATAAFVWHFIAVSNCVESMQHLQDGMTNMPWEYVINRESETEIFMTFHALLKGAIYHAYYTVCFSSAAHMRG